MKKEIVIFRNGWSGFNCFALGRFAKNHFVSEQDVAVQTTSRQMIRRFVIFPGERSSPPAFESMVTDFVNPEYFITRMDDIKWIVRPTFIRGFGQERIVKLSDAIKVDAKFIKEFQKIGMPLRKKWKCSYE